MQVVILCGGKGTRLSEYTEQIPKPLIEIGGKPILSHIMEMYAGFGHKEFILCLGYKGDKIKDYFKDEKRFKIHFVDTGVNTNKGERILAARSLIKDENFFVAYGDDLSDVNIKKLQEFHLKNGKIVTLTAVQLESPFGIIEINKNNEVTKFKEKPKLEHFMNGGFYIFNKKIFGFITKGQDLEKDVLENLSKEKMVSAFIHKGFWKSMNTLKDVIELNEMFSKNTKPWIK